MNLNIECDARQSTAPGSWKSYSGNVNDPPDDDFRVNYRASLCGKVVTPTIDYLRASSEIYWYSQYSKVYTCGFILLNGFVFMKETEQVGTTTFFLLISDASAGTLSQAEFLNITNGYVVEVKVPYEYCGPAMQLALLSGETRWLFPHPDGQVAAWKYLQETTKEDDRQQLLPLGTHILKNRLPL